jgi:hypothetical protein
VPPRADWFSRDAREAIGVGALGGIACAVAGYVIGRAV